MRSMIMILIGCCLSVSLFAQLKQPVVYKSINEVPGYLKLVKPAVKKLDKREFTIRPSASPTKLPANFNITGRKKLVTGLKVVLPAVYAPGMNQEFSINANRFVDNNAQMILVAYDLTRTPRGIYVLKIREEFKNFQTAPINFQDNNHTILQLGWKVKVNSDGSFYLSTKAWPERLGVDVTGKIKMLAETESQKTKWIAYQNGWCNNTHIWLYNPASRTFLGRTMTGDVTGFTAIKAEDALNGRVPENIKLAWDFATLKEYVGLNGREPKSFFNYISRLDNDRDGDGLDATECGGSDCNDADGGVYAGNVEIADYRNPGRDEDCDPRTFGQRDSDGDGYFDDAYFNVSPDGTRYGGTDCDDNNAAIIPGAMKYISETQVEVCGLGLFNVGEGMRAVRQPNGTAIVIPR